MNHSLEILLLVKRTSYATRLPVASTHPTYMHEWGNLKRCGVELEANDLKNALILVELDWPDQDQMRGARKQPPAISRIERV